MDGVYRLGGPWEAGTRPASPPPAPVGNGQSGAAPLRVGTAPLIFSSTILCVILPAIQGASERAAIVLPGSFRTSSACIFNVESTQSSSLHRPAYHTLPFLALIVSRSMCNVRSQHHLVGSYNLQKIHTFAGLFAHFPVSNITREF